MSAPSIPDGSSLVEGNSVTSVRLSEYGVMVQPDPSIPCLEKLDPQDAGYDVFAAEDKWIFPFMVRRVPVNAIVELPLGHYGRVVGRSGESLRGNFVIEGTIDCGYRGVFNALMTRFSFFPRRVRKGDKIAQIIVTPYVEVEWKLGTEKDLSPSNRGKHGFGHSGN